MSNLPMLANASMLTVHQKRELGEMLTGFEGKNKYVIKADGTDVLMAVEKSGGALGFLTRSFLKAKRPFTIEIVDPGGTLVLKVVRPWTWFLSVVHVEDAGGSRLGSVAQQFAVFGRKFSVTAGGQTLGTISGAFLRRRTFKIHAGGKNVGAIQKKWGGLGKEMFTDADTFGLQLEGDDLLRALCLGGTFLIDFLYFEDRE